MTASNTLKFSIALAAAAGTHLGVLVVTASPSSSPVVAGNSFSVQFGTLAMDKGPTEATNEAQGEANKQPVVTEEDVAPPEAPSPSEPPPETERPADPPPQEPEPAEPLPKPAPKPETAVPEPEPEQPKPKPQTTPRQIIQQPVARETLPAEAQPSSPSPEGAPASPPETAEPTGNDISSEKSSQVPTARKDDKAVNTASPEKSQTGGTGNSDYSNYSGKVMRHLSRLRRPRASSPGSAYVSFVVAPSGTIEQIEISESSGSSRFDHDALAFVKKAAPFPTPPTGISRSFTVEIKGH